MYIDVTSPPSLAPQLDIFVIQHSFKIRVRVICSSRHIISSSPVRRRLWYPRSKVSCIGDRACVRTTPIVLPAFRSQVTPGSCFVLLPSFTMDPMQAIADLQTQVAQLQAKIQFLCSNSTPSRPKPSLPDPEKFNGQSHKFNT